MNRLYPKSKLSEQVLLDLIYCFAHEMALASAAERNDVSTKTVSRIYIQIRQKIRIHFEEVRDIIVDMLPPTKGKIIDFALMHISLGNSGSKREPSFTMNDDQTATLFLPKLNEAYSFDLNYEDFHKEMEKLFYSENGKKIADNKSFNRVAYLSQTNYKRKIKRLRGINQEQVLDLQHECLLEAHAQIELEYQTLAMAFDDGYEKKEGAIHEKLKLAYQFASMGACSLRQSTERQLSGGTQIDIDLESILPKEAYEMANRMMAQSITDLLCLHPLGED